MNYLSEVISGGYQSYSENRLSQIFAASFNQSKQFQRKFFNFVGYRIKKGIYSARREVSQVFRGGKGRNDIIIDRKIFNKKLDEIVIENKIEEQLGNIQLKNYNKISGLPQKRVALIKSCYEIIDDKLNWNVKHWHEFYLYLKNQKYKTIDDFVIKNFLNHMEELQMDAVNTITKEELIKISNFFYNTRYVLNNPYTAINPQNVNYNLFEIMNNYIKMLTSIVDRVNIKCCV